MPDFGVGWPRLLKAAPLPNSCLLICYSIYVNLKLYDKQPLCHSRCKTSLQASSWTTQHHRLTVKIMCTIEIDEPNVPMGLTYPTYSDPKKGEFLLCFSLNLCQSDAIFFIPYAILF